MGGNTTISNSATRIEALRLQSSAYGVVVPWVWGTARLAGNLLSYVDFKAIATTTEESQGGKGGGVTQQNTTYTYSACVIIGLCYGNGNASVRTVWRGKTKYVDMQTAGVMEGSRFPATVTVVANHGGVNYAVGDVLTPQGGTYSIPAQITVTGVGNNGTVVTVSVTQTGHYTELPRTPIATTSNSAGTGCQLSALDNTQYPTINSLGLGMITMNRPWDYLLAHHPAQAVPYSHIACFAGVDYPLSDQAGMENHSFEVVGAGATYMLRPQPATDADPAVILRDMLTDTVQGAAYPADQLASLTDYATYCRAAGLQLSPALTEQTAASDAVSTLLQLTNSAAVYSGGVLKIVPYGDSDIHANGVSWYANTRPVYDLTDDDLLAEEGEVPIRVSRKAQADTYNHVKIEYCNRANDYAIEIAEAKDQADIETNGLRTQDALSAHWVADPDIARHVAQLILQRALYIRNTYEFRLSWKHALLEPMDLVTLTDPEMGLTQTPVRIVSVEEDETGTLTVTAEDYPPGVASATRYPAPRGGGQVLNTNADPGSVRDPLIFMPALGQTDGALQVWAAVGGVKANWGGCNLWVSTDDAQYRKAGTLHGASRYGVLAAPATDDSLTVTLNSGQLLSATAQDAALGATACWVDGEIIAYTTAALIAANTYKLTGLVRGMYGTTKAAHAAGAGFARLDAAIIKSDTLDAALKGKTLFLKFTSFTVFGTAEQSLADARAYSFKVGTLAGDGSTPAGQPPATVSSGITITYDEVGNVIIAFPHTNDPNVSYWELRKGTSFEVGSNEATSTGAPIVLPVSQVIGNVYWLAPRYTSGFYADTASRIAFDGNPLAPVTGVSVKIMEPGLQFSWAPVAGATRYIVYWEDNGVTWVHTYGDPICYVQIPRGHNALLRVVAANNLGQFSAPFDQTVSLAGTYLYNEVAAIPLDFSTGQFNNIARIDGTHLERVSLVGPSVVSFPVSNVNDASLYALGYNLEHVTGAALNATPGSWFRNGFWRVTESSYESLPVDLGKVLTGRLSLALTKSVTYYGNGPGSAFAQVRGEYLADSLGQDLVDTHAFLSAQFYTSTDGTTWTPANNGDWCTCRYVKIIVQAEKISALTQVDVTAGSLYLDVPDKTQTGTVSVTGSQTVALPDGWTQVDLVLLTPHASCKTWATSVGPAGFTLNTDSGSAVSVDYFVKGF